MHAVYLIHSSLHTAFIHSFIHSENSCVAPTNQAMFWTHTEREAVLSGNFLFQQEKADVEDELLTEYNFAFLYNEETDA